MSTAKRAAKARKARSQIAVVFRALDNDQINIVDVLRDPPYALRRIRVYDVLRRTPNLNRDGAERVLRHAKTWPLTSMGNLSLEERERIIANLPPRVKR